MKVRRLSAFLMTAVLLITAAGCKNSKGEETTSSVSESSVSEAIVSVTEDITETESTTEGAETATTAENSETTSSNSNADTTASAETANSNRSTNPTSPINITGFTGLNPNIFKQGEKFFDDAIFVGDSVTLGLKNYVTSERNAGRSCLGKAQFLCEGSLGYINSNSGVLEPSFRGSKVRIEDGIKQSGAKKVFIMLGMNDFYGYGENVAMTAARATIDNIIAKNPEVKIFIESVTPITKEKQHGGFNNDNVDSFNEQLKGLCNEYKLTYVDINSVLKDSSGNLNPDYCGDASSMGIHMSYPGCKAWVNYLENNF